MEVRTTAEQIVRSMWAAKDAGDRRATAAYFSPDLRWHLFGGDDHAMSGDYVGWEENGHLQRLIHLESRDTFVAHLVDARAVGDELVVVTMEVGLDTPEGPQTMPGVWIGHVRDGLIDEVWDIVRPVPAPVLVEAARAVAELGRLPGSTPAPQ